MSKTITKVADDKPVLFGLKANEMRKKNKEKMPFIFPKSVVEMANFTES